MAGKVTLSATKGPIKGNIFTFEEHDTFIFGRATDCHARLAEDDKTASRYHFILEVNPPDASVRDLGSLNGTYVNEIKYGGRKESETPEDAAKKTFPQVALKDKDSIRVGHTVFTVQIEAPLVCCVCCIDIPPNFKKICCWNDNKYICPECREKVESDKTQLDSFTIANNPKCDNCGKDVSLEIGNRQGSYICSTCQAKSIRDPLSSLLKMVKSTYKADESFRENIEGYELTKKLGEGGMGVVYLARNSKTQEMVAIKMMLAVVAVDEPSRKMFHREIDVTRTLKHQNIVRLIEHGSAGSGFYFVMEYCAGGDLNSLIKERGGSLSLSEAMPIMLQILEGLAFAHSKGFVHRDLKPANILLTAKDGAIAKISDFGLAKNFQQSGFSGMTTTGAMGGTPSFMPKEQLTNFKLCRPVSDVWSIAATFYTMLTGQYCRDFSSGKDPIQVILQGGIIPIKKHNPYLPKKLTDVIEQALTDNIQERYQTAIEFRDALIKLI